MAKVFLSAGHGGSDPGAVAYGMKEKDINLNIMLACRDELQRHGITVICSRTKDEDDKVGSEVAEANASGADVAASFHTNAGKGNGSETFCNLNNANGKKLAELCEKHVKAIGQNSRGVKSGSHLYFIKRTNMTAVLCECAFIDNDKDNDIIDTTAEQKAFGVAYAKAILEYLGIAYNSTPTPTPTPTSNSNSIPTNVTSTGFKVKVDIPDLNIRKGPGTNYSKIGKFTGKGTFTIIEVKSGTGSKTGWGKLKSGLGWISLDYAKKI